MRKDIRNGIAIVIVLIIVIIAVKHTATHKPQYFFRKPIAADLTDMAATQLYYAPPWLGALSGSPALADVLNGCRKDPNCVAVQYTEEEQEASKHGNTAADYCLHVPNPPDCIATAYPFQLSPGTQTIYFKRTNPSVGPNLYVKRKYRMEEKK